MTKRVLHSLSVILLAAVSAFAEQPITVQIPFSFHVGNSVFPAGSYRADTDVAPGVLRLRSDDGKKAVMTLYTHVQSNAPSTGSKLVFHKYADQYFLYQLWSNGSSDGGQLLRSKSETEIATTGRRSIQAVLATR